MRPTYDLVVLDGPEDRLLIKEVQAGVYGFSGTDQHHE